MTEHEETLRRERQGRALTVHGNGALIETQYHSRTSRVVPVNESDLRDLLGFDAIELILMGVGQFFASGSLWLFVDRYSEPKFTWTAVTGFCAAAFIFGVVMIVAAICMRFMKRGKINRIFAETAPRD
jgi:hypothetical protein